MRKEACRDRAAWLTELAGQGTRAATQRLRGQKKGEGRLANEHGELVESDQRADTFAEYLERVQWAVRPAALVDRPQLFPTMRVRSDKITVKELRDAACALRNGRLLAQMVCLSSTGKHCCGMVIVKLRNGWWICAIDVGCKGKSQRIGTFTKWQ